MLCGWKKIWLKIRERLLSRSVNDGGVVASPRVALATAQSDDLQALLAERLEGGIKPPAQRVC